MQHTTIAALLLLTVTAVPAAAQCLHSFDAPQSIAVATSTAPAGVADFDGDGRADLYTPDAIYLGFSKRVSIAPNGPAAQVRVTDVNRDGFADVVGTATAVFDVGSNELVVLVNKGDATFTRKTTPFVTNHFPSFAWGDFNGDGLLDAFVTGSPGVYLAAGDGTFQREDGVPYSAMGHWMAADVNGDNLDDLIVAADAPGPVIIYRREGHGFTGALGPTLGGIPVAVADFDRDGRDDIVTASGVQPGAIVFNLGGISARANATFSAPTLPSDFAVTDFNADGAPDLAVNRRNALAVRIYLNDGQGGLEASEELPGFKDMPLLADIDGDGIVDLVTTERVRPVILRGKGDGTFRVPRVALAAAGTGAAGDLDGDGDDDIALPSAIAWNKGDNTFDLVPVSDDRAHSVFQVADVTGDGIAELIAMTTLGTTVVLRVRADGLLAEIARFDVHPNHLAVGDFSGADRPELAMLTHNTLQVFEVRTGAAARFVLPLPSSPGPLPQSLAVADLNGDGADDILVAGGTINYFPLSPPTGSSDGYLSVFLSTGSSFEPERRTEYPSAALHQLVTGDFDGDGKTDAAASTMLETPRMAAFFGDGHGMFPRRQETLISSTFYPEDDYLLRAADLNGDGRTDVAVNGAASIFYGAPGGFIGPARYFGPFSRYAPSTYVPLLVRPRRGALPSIIAALGSGSDALIYRPLCSRPRPVRH